MHSSSQNGSGAIQLGIVAVVERTTTSVLPNIDVKIQYTHDFDDLGQAFWFPLG